MSVKLSNHELIYDVVLLHNSTLLHEFEVCTECAQISIVMLCRICIGKFFRGYMPMKITPIYIDNNHSCRVISSWLNSDERSDFNLNDKHRKINVRQTSKYNRMINIENYLYDKHRNINV
jgi:hypothetical protein